MLKVTEIVWLSLDALEARLVVTDGSISLFCFSHLINIKNGDYVDEPLHAVGVKRVMKQEGANFGFEKQSNPFGYLFEANLLDKKLGHVIVGKVTIEIDSRFIPDDLQNGDFISFVCDRLDIY